MKEELRNWVIKKNNKETIWAFVANLLDALFGLFIISLPLIVTKDFFGQFNYYLSLILFIQVFTDFGLNRAIARRISRIIKTTKDISPAVNSYKYFRRINFILCILFSILLFLFFDKSPYNIWLIIITIACFLTYYLDFYTFFNAIHRNKYLAISSFVKNFVSVIALLIPIIYSFTIEYLLLSYLIGLIISSSFVRWLFFKKVSYQKTVILEKGVFLESSFFLLSSGSGILLREVNVILLSIFGNFSWVAEFSIIKYLNRGINIIPLSLGMGIAPLFSEIDTGNKDKLIRIFTKYFIFLILIYIFILSFIFIFSKHMIIYFYESEYLSLVSLLRIGIAYFFLAGINTFLVRFSDYMGLIKKRVVFMNVSLLLNISLSIILIPHYGVKGSLVSLIATYLFYTSCNLMTIYQKFK
ncbi:oligosaccharide flippase family protein [Candidatus Parcubacteria bacterium]|nr:oligosaccharide flippase family protein [Candidatus Parcubacteria bacterium]